VGEVPPIDDNCCCPILWVYCSDIFDEFVSTLTVNDLPKDQANAVGWVTRRGASNERINWARGYGRCYHQTA
jgi:hypothetical protein